MTNYVTLQLAKMLHQEQRPFYVMIEHFDGDGDPILNRDFEHVATKFWSRWDVETGQVVIHGANEKEYLGAWEVSAEAAFSEIEKLIQEGNKYCLETRYAYSEVRPMNWSNLPLVYRKIAQLAPHDLNANVRALDKNGNLVMELTAEGAMTLCGFNSNLA